MQELFPAIAFIASYVIARYAGYNDESIFIATAVLIAASILQMVWMWLSKKKIEKRHWLTLLLIVVLGSITLLIHDDLFIKMKPTILNAIIAVVFFGSQYIGKENITKRMLNNAFEMPDYLWKRLNYTWIGFFIFEGVLNIYVALNFDNDVYVSFKFWGLIILTFLFLIAQFVVLRKYLRHDKKE